MKDNSEDFVFGVHPVLEALKSEATVDKLLASRDMRGEQIKEIRQHCKNAGVMLKQVPEEKLSRITRKNHQGVIAFLSPIEFQSIENILPQIIEAGKIPRILILDGVTDVRNFGAMVRTAECMGIQAIVIPARSGVAINSDVVKTSAGAIFNVPICKEVHFGSILQFLSDSGCRLLVCHEKTNKLIYEADLTGPLAIIVGDEGEGINEKTLERCHEQVKIPTSGKTASLNVSVATGMVLSEMQRQIGLSS